MNFLESSGPGDEAVIEYGDGDFQILKPGAFVTCAVTGTRIPLKALRYWSVDKQEPYVNAEAAHQGFGLKKQD